MFAGWTMRHRITKSPMIWLATVSCPHVLGSPGSGGSALFAAGGQHVAIGIDMEAMQPLDPPSNTGCETDR